MRVPVAHSFVELAELDQEPYEAAEPGKAPTRTRLPATRKPPGLTGKMNDPELSLAERHHWTQVHTYTAQVLNTILRDLQLKDWEKRLKELEQPRLTNKTLPTR